MRDRQYLVALSGPAVLYLDRLLSGMVAGPEGSRAELVEAVTSLAKTVRTNSVRQKQIQVVATHVECEDERARRGAPAARIAP